jgi:hypothetical protein
MPETATAGSFEALRQDLATGGPKAVFDRLATQLVAGEKYHELFDLRLLQSRLDAGLPVILTKTLDELPPEVQAQVEDAQLAACREVGEHLLRANRYTDAWYYLRIPGDRQTMAAALETAKPDPEDEEEIEQLVNIAFHEGVAPRAGLGWVLEHYGTCNAVTLFDQAAARLMPTARQACSELMVEHLYAELVASLKREIARQEGQEPEGDSLWSLIGDRDWLFSEDAYHIDTSHLAMVVRFARWARDAEALHRAADLCEYGSRLGEQFQYDGEEPFAEFYPHHRLFFRAQFGKDVEAALKHFEDRARTIDVRNQSSLPAEIYITLLSRIGRAEDALNACLELLPEGVPTQGLVPTVLELARQAKAYDRLCALSEKRGDPLAFVAGLLQQWQDR